MYQALYRKYRPNNFNEVVGQQSVVKTLKNSIMNHSFSHAYMFFGPRGTGKTTISKIFARSINCLESKDGNMCGICDNCQISCDKECVDIIEIDAASNNGVDEIRELKNKISLVPTKLKYKVYIIDEVHMLSIGAFNALLKTLEEPPAHVVFILATTDPQKVPETIVSRCQCFSFERLSQNTIIERLKFVCKNEKISIDQEVLIEIANISGGGMRDALGMLDKLRSYTTKKITLQDFTDLNGLITQKQMSRFSDHIFRGNISEIFTDINEFNDSGKNIVQIIIQLMFYLRNLLIDYYTKNLDCGYSVLNLQALINCINENLFDIKRSENPRIYVEIMLLKFVHMLEDKKEKNISREIISEVDVIKKEKERPKKSASKSSIAVSDVIQADDSNTILNIDDIISIRVNNTLALASKQLLKKEIENFENLNDYTFDQNFGYVVCSLLDSKIRAVSDDSIILSYEYDSVVKQNLQMIDHLTNIYNQITNSNKKLAIISDEKWEEEKLKYIKTLKEGKSYSILDEPKEIFRDNKKSDIITNSAVELFGDIVEFD